MTPDELEDGLELDELEDGVGGTPGLPRMNMLFPTHGPYTYMYSPIGLY